MAKKDSEIDDFDDEFDNDAKDYDLEDEKSPLLKVYNSARQRLDSLQLDKEMARLLNGGCEVWD